MEAKKSKKAAIENQRLLFILFFSLLLDKIYE